MKLTEQEHKDLCKFIKEAARSRKETLGEDYHDADFVAGALSVFMGLNLKQPPWAIFVMSGRDWTQP